MLQICSGMSGSINLEVVASTTSATGVVTTRGGSVSVFSGLVVVSDKTTRGTRATAKTQNKIRYILPSALQNVSRFDVNNNNLNLE